MAVAVEDPGRKARFEILHRDVERKVLEPLRTHNWAANIEREVGEGEYFIIAARAGVSHRITVFCTSATANGAYKQAAAQVEHSEPSCVAACYFFLPRSSPSSPSISGG